MSHPFGDLLTQYLHRKHGLSQSRLAAGILQDPSVIAKMCKGQRLNGPQARERMLAILNWLHMQGVMDRPDEADALLMAAGLAPLQVAQKADLALIQQLQKSSQSALNRRRNEAIQTQTRISSDYSLIGRERELAILRIAFRTALQGSAHFVALEGEAGIGKTRLAEEILLDAQHEGCAIARTRTYALEGRLAYGPIADWLRSSALAMKVRNLAAVWRTEIARLLPELLIEDPTLSAPPPMTDRWQRKHLFEALLQVVTALEVPLVLQLDDMQWCDAETLEWLHYLLVAASHAKILIVGTVRADELEKAHPLHHIWPKLLRDEQLTRVALVPLSETETHRLGEEIARRSLDAVSAQNLFGQSAGNPLFVIETMRAQQDNLHVNVIRTLPESSATSVPPKIYAVIQMRLAQLSPDARMLADIAAVLGSAFTVALLAEATKQDEVVVVRGIDELWQRRLLREDAIAVYDFSHDHIRDVVYAEISPVRRQMLHRDVAEALKRRSAGKVTDVQAQLAIHYEAAGVLDKAILHVFNAIHHSIALSAMHNGLTLVTQGLRIVQLLPETEDTVRKAIQLYSLQGDCLRACLSWNDPQVHHAYSQAYLLSQKINDRRGIYLGRTHLRWFHSLRAEWIQAQVLAEQNILLAETIADPELLEDAYHAMGRVCFYRGYLLPARYWYEKAILSMGGSEPWNAMQSKVSLDSYTFLNFAHCLCLLGYPQLGRQTSANGVQRAYDGDQFMVAGALQFNLIVNHMLRDFIAFERENHLLQELAHRYEFPFFIELSRLFQGYILTWRGQPEAGIEKIKNSIPYFETQEFGMFYAHLLGLLIEACLIGGDYAQGLSVCDKAEAFMARTNDVFWEPEIQRLKGELQLAQSGMVHDAEASYRHAIALSREQNSKWFELRASVSLARLWQHQNKHAEAGQLLTGIYNWFSEGFDTPDLVDARALLNNLS